jgi:hypothetical protein
VHSFRWAGWPFLLVYCAAYEEDCDEAETCDVGCPLPAGAEGVAGEAAAEGVAGEAGASDGGSTTRGWQKNATRLGPGTVMLSELPLLDTVAPPR